MAETEVQRLLREWTQLKAETDARETENDAREKELLSLRAELLIGNLQNALTRQGRRSPQFLNEAQATQLRPMRLGCIHNRLEYRMNVVDADDMCTIHMSYTCDIDTWCAETIQALCATGHLSKCDGIYCELRLYAAPYWIGAPTVYDTLVELY